MALVRWDPFRDLERIFDEGRWPAAGNFGWDLAVDVYEKEGKIVAEMQLPGIDPDKVDVSFEDAQHLRITGSREEEQKTEEKNYYSREIRRGAFERLVRLPEPVETEQAEAEYESGVLRVVMPKQTERKAEQRRIKIAKK